jgi:hypothetical protein
MEQQLLVIVENGALTKCECKNLEFQIKRGSLKPGTYFFAGKKITVKLIGGPNET